MDGAGARLSRASSRYGQQPPSSSPANFSGPVRKWQKKWVLVSAPSKPSTAARNQKSSNGSQSNNNNNNKTDGGPPGVLLCKWTPISRRHTYSEADAADDNEDSPKPEEPPRRKLRYTPIAVLEQVKGEPLAKDNRDARDDEEDQGMVGNLPRNGAIHGIVNVNMSLMGDHLVAEEEFSTPPHSSKMPLNLEIAVESP